MRAIHALGDGLDFVFRGGAAVAAAADACRWRVLQPVAVGDFGDGAAVAGVVGEVMSRDAACFAAVAAGCHAARVGADGEGGVGVVVASVVGVVPSHDAACVAVGGYRHAHVVAVGDGGVHGSSCDGTDVVEARYGAALDGEVLHRGFFDAAEEALVGVVAAAYREVADGVAAAVEGAGVCFVLLADGCPRCAFEVDVGGEGAVGGLSVGAVHDGGKLKEGAGAGGLVAAVA